jgi:hypothetical protein
MGLIMVRRPNVTFQNRLEFSPFIVVSQPQMVNSVADSGPDNILECHRIRARIIDCIKLIEITLVLSHAGDDPICVKDVRISGIQGSHTFPNARTSLTYTPVVVRPRETIDTPAAAGYGELNVASINVDCSP